MFRISRKALSLVLAAVFALSAAAFAPIAPIRLSAASAAGTHKVTTGKGDFDVYDSYTVKLKEGGITIAFTGVALRYQYFKTQNPPHYQFYVEDGGTVTFDRDIGLAEKGVPITITQTPALSPGYEYIANGAKIDIVRLDKKETWYGVIGNSMVLDSTPELSSIRTDATVAKVTPAPPLNMSGGDFTVENGVLTKYNGKGGAVTIPDGVKVIGGKAFMDCVALTSVTFPNSVKQIEGALLDGAFLRCSALTSVTFGNGLVDIGDAAFYLCTSLKSVTIPQGVTKIGKDAFRKCVALTDVKMADSVTRIGENAFDDCTSLRSVKFGNGLAYIDARAFLDCNSLTDAGLPSSLRSIGISAFQACSLLKSITIAEGVTEIPANAFLGCTSLESVTIKGKVKAIRKSAFNGCWALKEIRLPDSLLTIEEYAFTTDTVVVGSPGSAADKYAVAALEAKNKPSANLNIATCTIATGYNHSLAIKADGSLWAWGSNEYGQLGDGTTTDRITPVKVMDSVVSISAAIQHSYAITKDGSLYAWGDNLSPIGKHGGLGDGTNVNRLKPVKILGDVAYVSAGPITTIAIKKDGSLWAWGSQIPQLVSGKVSLYFYGTPIKIMDSVAYATAIQGAGLDSGGSAIKPDGSLWLWGGYVYLPGLTEVSKVVSEPTKAMDSVLSASIGGSHLTAIKTDGSLWAWGDYKWMEESTTTPVKISDSVVSVATTRFQDTLFIKKDGSLWGFGRNYYGTASGNGNDKPQNAPAKITDGVVEVATGDVHALVVKSDGSLWGWGSNYRGQLGNDVNVGEAKANKLTKIMDGVKLP